MNTPTITKTPCVNEKVNNKSSSASAATIKFRLIDFTIYDDNVSSNDGGDENNGGTGTESGQNQGFPHGKKNTVFNMIQMFGINEKGETASILAENFHPFFYVKVPDSWGEQDKNTFARHINRSVGPSACSSILSYTLVRHKKLYMFDAGRKYNFVVISFANMRAFHKVKGLWFVPFTNPDSGRREQNLIEGGYQYNGDYLEIYEANIPPLLKMFHMMNISPSGWVELNESNVHRISSLNKTTNCNFEFITDYKNIVALNQCEMRVPYNIMSFDIEASSSHGDFPVPVKSYKKLATNIVDYFDKHLSAPASKTPASDCALTLQNILTAAFEVGPPMLHIDNVFPKKPVKAGKSFDTLVDKWLKLTVRNYQETDTSDHDIEAMFDRINCQYNANAANNGKKMQGHAKSATSGTNTNTNTNINNTTQNTIVLDDDDGEADDNEDDDYDEADDNEDDHDEHDDKDECPDNEDPEDGTPVIRKQQILPLTSKYKNKTHTIVDIMRDVKTGRQDKIAELIISLKNVFPQLEGDKVTFIGSSFMRYGETEPYYRNCIVLGDCDQVEGENIDIDIEVCETERDVLLAWQQLVQRVNPDIIIGYNIFGFDYEFMFRRSLECHCAEDFLKISRNNGELCGSRDYRTGYMEIEKTSVTLASGTHDMSFIKRNGGMQIDLYNLFRKTENWTSYKLDYVSSQLIGDVVKKIEHRLCPETNTPKTRIYTKNMTGLYKNSYIHIDEISHSTNSYKNGEKFKIVNINKSGSESWFEIAGKESPAAKTVRWGLAKDDVTPKDIFRMTNEGPASKAIIAKYCIQDCDLPLYLLNKVDIITGFIEMSKLCSVPMSFLVFRGQGIKLTSFVAKKCREMGVLMPVVGKDRSNSGYEGAIVLDPKTGMYLDIAVAVGDFASLYPSSMQSENLCPSSKVYSQIFDLCNNLLEEHGEKNPDGSFKYDNLPGYKYVNKRFDTYRYVRKTPKAKAVKIISGYKICRYAQYPNGQYAVMPSILKELLKARKDTRKLIPQQTDDFMKSVLDQRQLAYKVTANSLYGQLGAKTSTFYEPDIAASTTATGRLLLTYAKKIVEECYGDYVHESEKFGQVHCSAEYVYGDTDSVFFKFNLTSVATGADILNKDALELSIEISQIATHMVSKFLKQPHDFEYEKTFMPFCLLSKKRYVGILYELDPNKGKRKEMGIVLKRRDNAPIVKDIYGGTIDILMNDRNIEKAMTFVSGCLDKLVTGNILMDKLIITKSLNSFYKNPKSIAHKVLSDRITMRDPGNKPSSGDRIPFVYISNPNKKALQGDRIETPTFIIENKLNIDYAFYITNQIMKPMQQLFGLILKDIWKLVDKSGKRERSFKLAESMIAAADDLEPEAREKKLTNLRNKEAKTLIFDKYIISATNKKEGNRDIRSIFGLVKK